VKHEAVYIQEASHVTTTPFDLSPSFPTTIIILVLTAIVIVTVTVIDR
jgi:hypothetical protein